MPKGSSREERRRPWLLDQSFTGPPLVAYSFSQGVQEAQSFTVGIAGNLTEVTFACRTSPPCHGQIRVGPVMCNRREREADEVRRRARLIPKNPVIPSERATSHFTTLLPELDEGSITRRSYSRTTRSLKIAVRFASCRAFPEALSEAWVTTLLSLFY